MHEPVHSFIAASVSIVSSGQIHHFSWLQKTAWAAEVIKMGTSVLWAVGRTIGRTKLMMD